MLFKHLKSLALHTCADYLEIFCSKWNVLVSSPLKEALAPEVAPSDCLKNSFSLLFNFLERYF